MGMIVAIGVLIAAIWMLAIYDTVQDAHEEKYDVSVRPGAVSYGTHSSATIPMVSAPTHHTSAPMISGGAIRSYAHYGHAAYTVHHTPYTVHTTSSATVHTIGSGGGGGVSSPPSGGGGASSSSRGITYGGASVSMPTFALVTPVYAAENTEMSQRKGAGPRKMPGWDGDEGDTEWDEGKWWYWDADSETWVTDENMQDKYVGLTRNTGSGIEVWNGSGWVTMGEWNNPGVPVGTTPWLLMAFLAFGYTIVRKLRRKQSKI